MSPQLIRQFRAWEICLSRSSLPCFAGPHSLKAACLLSASVYTCVYVCVCTPQGRHNIAVHLSPQNSLQGGPTWLSKRPPPQKCAHPLSKRPSGLLYLATHSHCAWARWPPWMESVPGHTSGARCPKSCVAHTLCAVRQGGRPEGCWNHILLGPESPFCHMVSEVPQTLAEHQAAPESPPVKLLDPDRVPGTQSAWLFPVLERETRGPLDAGQALPGLGVGWLTG